MSNHTQNSTDFSSYLSDFSELYSDILGYLFYPEAHKAAFATKLDNNFNQWIETFSQSDDIDLELQEKMASLCSEFKTLYTSMIEHVSNSGEKPDVKSFEQLSNIYDACINNLRRYERDSVLENNGIDALTGLRTKTVMKSDIEREFDRLARRGKPFCLAIARIDHYDEIVDEHGRSYAREITKKIAELIKKSIRSFDDGYRLGSGEFILSLKQANVTGGIAALERLRKMLIGANIKYKIKGKSKALTMSCCIAEPLPGDDFFELISHLRKDLETAERPVNSLLEYRELSELQRYIQNNAS
ncbi:MAG: diguanylate cyclase domain-containing protein [Alphaproteobacteria bacterium]